MWHVSTKKYLQEPTRLLSGIPGSSPPVCFVSKTMSSVEFTDLSHGNAVMDHDLSVRDRDWQRHMEFQPVL